jgi:16S rRNA (cytosine967-C5)-methyltransferase
MPPLQLGILRRALALVAPGGRLVYATCSLLREENEAQIEAFLEAHVDFKLVPLDSVWAEAIGTPRPDDAEAAMLSLTPAQHGTDGFFAAVLERVKVPK